MSGAPVALVAGCASKLGQAVVRRLAFAGYRVAAADTCRGSVTKIAEENLKLGGQVTGFAVDISKADHRKELFEKLREKYDGLDSLVIVPGKNPLQADIMSTSSLQFDTIFEGYMTTPFRLTQAAIPLLKDSKNGSIVYMTSSLGFAPNVEVGLFSTACTGVLAMTRCIAQSAAKRGIRVNSVVTAMMEDDGTGAIWDDKRGNEQDVKMVRDGLAAMIPLGRLGRPTDAANYVEFLLSPRARYITGENCIINGGVSFRL